MSNTSQEALLETLEVGVDQISVTVLKEVFGESVASILKELPVVKWGPVLAEAVTKARDKKKAKRLLALYKELLDGNGQKELKELSVKDASKLKVLVTDLMEHQVHDNQIQALGLLLDALGEGKISRRMFVGLMHELRYINPLVYDSKTEFVFGNTFKMEVNIDGPLHYLPASFWAHRGEKIAFTATHCLLTDLGRTFFEYVYKPVMAANNRTIVQTFTQDKF